MPARLDDKAALKAIGRLRRVALEPGLCGDQARAGTLRESQMLL